MGGEKSGKRSGQGAEEPVVVAWEGPVGREDQTPMRLGPSVRLRAEGQVVLDVLSYDGAFELLSSGK